MRISTKTALAVISLLSAPAIAQAAEDSNDLPVRLQSCIPKANNDGTVETRYDKCFSYPEKYFYGAAYLAFKNDRMDLMSYLAEREKSERKTFLKLLKSLFINEADTAIYAARITAMPGGGRPAYHVGTFELMRVTKADKNGKQFNVSKATKDGLEQPFFIAESGSKIQVELGFFAEKKVEFSITNAIFELNSLITTLGLYSGKQSLEQPVRTKLEKLENFLTSQFQNTGLFSNKVDLSFNELDTQAFTTKVNLGRILPDELSGDLAIAAVPIDSMFTNQARFETGTEIQNERKFDNLQPDDVKVKFVNGIRLSDHIRKELGEVYRDLSYTEDPDTFLKACRSMVYQLDQGSLFLTPDDKTATTWAFIRDNSSLQSPEVRDNYCLAAKEKAGRLLGLGLGLPNKTPAALDANSEAILVAAQRNADQADVKSIMAQQAVNKALTAESKAVLPSPAEGYVINSANNGFANFAGEAQDLNRPFHGVATEKVTNRMGNRYEGSLVLAGSSLIYEGLGRYTPVSSNPEMQYSSFMGSFEGNYFSGFGVMTWPDGKEFKGMFAKDKPSGFGIMYYPDGSKIYLRMINGLPNGNAVKEDKNGRFGGKWIEGVFLRTNN